MIKAWVNKNKGICQGVSLPPGYLRSPSWVPAFVLIPNGEGPTPYWSKCGQIKTNGSSRTYIGTFYWSTVDFNICLQEQEPSLNGGVMSTFTHHSIFYTSNLFELSSKSHNHPFLPLRWFQAGEGPTPCWQKCGWVRKKSFYQYVNYYTKYRSSWSQVSAFVLILKGD